MMRYKSVAQIKWDFFKPEHSSSFPNRSLIRSLILLCMSLRNCPHFFFFSFVFYFFLSRESYKIKMNNL